MLKRISVILFMLAGLLVPVAVMQPAQATAGCGGTQIDKVDVWSNRVTYLYYVFPDPFLPRSARLRISESVVYAFCPQGTAVDLVKVKMIDYCYSWTEGDEPDSYFQGVKYNPYFLDDNESVNPPQAFVENTNNDDLQKCLTHTVPLTDRVWFEMSQEPRWRVSCWIAVALNNDKHHDMIYDGSTTKYFRPAEDNNVSGWYS